MGEAQNGRSTRTVYYLSSERPQCATTPQCQIAPIPEVKGLNQEGSVVVAFASWVPLSRGELHKTQSPNTAVENPQLLHLLECSDWEIEE